MQFKSFYWLSHHGVRAIIIHSKYFPVLLAKTTRIIGHNQLLLTKFGKKIVILSQGCQNDVKSAASCRLLN